MSACSALIEARSASLNVRRKRVMQVVESKALHSHGASPVLRQELPERAAAPASGPFNLAWILGKNDELWLHFVGGS
jgi:hypothetical protein